MIGNRCLALLIGLSAGIGTTLTSWAAAPNPPTNVCVNGVCSGITVTSGSSTAAKAVKFHPGVYAYYIPPGVNYVPGTRWDLSEQRASVISFIDSICFESSIKGVQLVALWKTLEGDTPGDYSAGFKAVDAVLAKLSSCGKYLHLGLVGEMFGFVSDATWVLPSYIVGGATFNSTSGWSGSSGPYGLSNLAPGGTVNPWAGFSARVWQRATADRLVALSAAYGARYNSNPNLEAFSLIGESALAIWTDGQSDENLLTQLKYVYSAARSHWPNTGLKLWVNYLGSDSNFVDLYKFCKPIFCIISNPDIWPTDITPSDRIFAGKDSSGANVYEDMRDVLPWSADADWISFNLSTTTGSPLFSLQQLWDAPLIGYTARDPRGGPDFMMPSLKPRYATWYVNYANGTSANQWNSAELSFIRANAAAYNNVACPSSYPACNRQ